MRPGWWPGRYRPPGDGGGFPERAWWGRQGVRPAARRAPLRRDGMCRTARMLRTPCPAAPTCPPRHQDRRVFAGWLGRLVDDIPCRARCAASAERLPHGLGEFVQRSVEVGPAVRVAVVLEERGELVGTRSRRREHRQVVQPEEPDCTRLPVESGRWFGVVQTVDEEEQLVDVPRARRMAVTPGAVVDAGKLGRPHPDPG